MSNLVNKYLNRSIFYDFLTSLILGVVIYSFIYCNFIVIPNQELIRNLMSDLAGIAFTSAGFILTILTVLITFKANSKKEKRIKDYDSALSLFFSTPLYSTATHILKNCIKILLVVALVSFLLKAFSKSIDVEILFSLLFAPLILITMALVRCVIILGKILKLQNVE